METAKIFWSGRSQAVRLPKDFRFDADEVRIRKHGNAVILEPVTDDWQWLDAIVGALDNDFADALTEQPGPRERKGAGQGISLMRYLLDTNVVIALLHDATSALARTARQHRPGSTYISAIVAHELFFGAYKSRRAEQNVALVESLRLEVLDFDKDDARMAGQVHAGLAVKGSPIGPYDVLIAGQALARDMILVTRNTPEFSRVPGLRFEDWEA